MEKAALIGQLKEIQEKLKNLDNLLNLPQKRERLKLLEKKTLENGFWNDQKKAGEISKEISEIKELLELFERLQGDSQAILEMIEMDPSTNAQGLDPEYEEQVAHIEKELNKLETETLFDGKHDNEGAIVSLHSGSGGTEAQDWAEMLQRMYLRFAEKQGWKVTLLDESRGNEAGIKSATLLIEGKKVYGYMQSEHGTHRLVRISPFDAEGMRHTSFAGVEVVPNIENTDFVLDEKDLRIDTYCSSGKGGQSVNTTYSAVRIVHIPTGITAQCQNERSQLQNKETAMKVLISKLQKKQEEEDEAKMKELKGEHKAAGWGNQIRSYVLHPYKMVKDLRTRYETKEPEKFLDGELEDVMVSYLEWKKHEARAT